MRTAREDLRVRTVANKSKLKISIIQAIDRKIDLNEVAESNAIDFDQLLEPDEGSSVTFSGKNPIRSAYSFDKTLVAILGLEVSDDEMAYIQTDLGDTLLFKEIEKGRLTRSFLRIVSIKRWWPYWGGC